MGPKPFVINLVFNKPLNGLKLLGFTVSFSPLLSWSYFTLLITGMLEAKQLGDIRIHTCEKSHFLGCTDVRFDERPNKVEKWP